MKKEVVHTEYVLVCDICGKEEEFNGRREIWACSICGKDICTECVVRVGQGYSSVDSGVLNLCPEHVPEEFLTRLGVRADG